MYLMTDNNVLADNNVIRAWTDNNTIMAIFICTN